MNNRAASTREATVYGGVRRAVLVMAMTATTLPAFAQQVHHHGGKPGTSPLTVFVASTAKPFAALMDDAMAVMDEGMKHAAMNGVTEHDFITMMIPHHQGAIDMAKAVLLYTKDPELKNLAQGIITEQQNEIRVMQAWLNLLKLQTIYSVYVNGQKTPVALFKTNLNGMANGTAIGPLRDVSSTLSSKKVSRSTIFVTEGDAPGDLRKAVLAGS